jgi:hypothetical protein
LKSRVILADFIGIDKAKADVTRRYYQPIGDARKLVVALIERNTADAA